MSNELMTLEASKTVNYSRTTSPRIVNTHRTGGYVPDVAASTLKTLNPQIKRALAKNGRSDVVSRSGRSQARYIADVQTEEHASIFPAQALSKLNRTQRRQWAKWFKQQHWLFQVGFSMVVSLLLWSTSVHVVSWYVGNVANAFAYGGARIYTTSAVIAQGQKPSTIMTWQQDHQVRVMIQLEGDSAKAKLFTGPQLSGDTQRIVLPVTVQDVNGDGYSDLDLHVQDGSVEINFAKKGPHVVLYGDGQGNFRPTPPMEKK